MKNQLIEIIMKAGQLILEHYGDLNFKEKSDNSPVTAADLASHNYLLNTLPLVKNIPVLSEENSIDYNIRKNWTEFWIIDPLDGTKEFINGYEDFCINIALIKNQVPILGLIYVPILNELYWAKEAEGFEYIGYKRKKRTEENIIVATSRFHHSDYTKSFMELNFLNEFSTVGAAIKFGRMAIGEIDLYPRYEGTKEWDTAAGQIILKEAGGRIVDLNTLQEPLYNKIDLRNNFFIAARSTINISQLKRPNLQ